MFTLKEKTHNIFRAGKRDKKKRVITGDEELFDLIIASIFHELLHLKEYVYTLEAYTTRYSHLKSSFKKAKIKISESDFIKYSHQIILEAKEGLPNKASEVENLFENAYTHLKRCLPQYNNDNTFIRTLFIDNATLDKYITGGLKTFYKLMYKYRTIEGFYIVGNSFKESGFYDKADEAFRLAIEESKNISEILPPEKHIIELTRKGLVDIYAKHKEICPIFKK
jgi:tetratricopeptide (TPR) repeat protein